MRHGTSNRRPRNRGHSGSGGGNRQSGGSPNRAQVFDSNGPEVRIRGTAYQIQEKYMALAKDAASIGDQVLSESYLQHAEHYQRVINEWAAHQSVRNEANAQQPIVTDDRTHQPSAPTKATSEDLGLPSSILGAKRETATPEPADA